MKKKEAIEELNRLSESYDPESGKLLVGTPPLREKFGSRLDDWHSLNEHFNPVAVIATVYDGGYQWTCYYVFRNADRAFVTIRGSGGSDSGPGYVTPEMWPNEDAALQSIRDDMDDGSESRSADARKAYHQFLTWIVSGRKVT